MSSVRQVYQLARRDFVERARSRAFLISLLITVGLALTVGPLIALVSGDPDPAVIGIVGDAPQGIEVELEARASDLQIEVTTTRFTSQDAGEAALETDDADVLVVDGAQLVWKEEAGSRLSAVVTGAFATIERRQVAEELGLEPDQVGRLLSPTAMTNRVLQAPEPEEAPREVAAFVGLMVLYIAILMFGQFVLMGVMEEKQNRVIEVVLSRVRPVQVLSGKVIGIGLLGLVQVVVLGGAALVAVSVIDITDVDVSSIGIEIFAGVVLWFLLGYAFYSMLYGAVGATITRQEDVQGAALIPVLMILPGFFFGQITAQDPDVLIAEFASLFPLWSPMVMPVRAAVDVVPLWEVALAALLVVASTYGLARLGGRIYAGAILELGRRVKLRDAWSAARN